MLTFRSKITHQRQGHKPNCGPIALSCLFQNPLEELEKIVKCDSRGTYTWKAFDGLKAAGISCNLINLDQDYSDHFWWIKQCSLHWPIYAGCNFVNQGKRGRPSESHHAVLFANGFCFDGREVREEVIEGIESKFNKRFTISDLIIFEHELDGWRTAANEGNPLL